MPFLLLPLGVLGGGGVSAFQGHQWYQNITTGEPWVGGVDILQDEYGVPDSTGYPSPSDNHHMILSWYDPVT